MAILSSSPALDTGVGGRGEEKRRVVTSGHEALAARRAAGGGGAGDGPMGRRPRERDDT